MYRNRNYSNCSHKHNITAVLAMYAATFIILPTLLGHTSDWREYRFKANFRLSVTNVYGTKIWWVISDTSPRISLTGLDVRT